ncbi:MAG TPA: hypothetical protein VFP84_18800 [Kofleriaceae bacterium]|nr:hypothetical protein [Kofleriaceae bacterium]
MNKKTGEDVAGGPHKVNLNNRLHAHDCAPSSIQCYRESNKSEDCGLLFLTDAYLAAIKTQTDLAGVNIPNIAGGDGKWPLSAGVDESVLQSIAKAINVFNDFIRDNVSSTTKIQLEEDQRHAIITLFELVNIPLPSILIK